MLLCHSDRILRSEEDLVYIGRESRGVLLGSEVTLDYFGNKI